MTIETYSDRYFLDVVRLVENFHNEAIGEYDGFFDPQAVIDTIKAHKEQNAGTAFLLVLDGACQGILFGTQFKSMTSDSRIFQEVIWYVNKPYRRHGVQLLREVERILKDKGFNVLIMAVLENSKTEKLKKLYETLGYKPMETHYVRTL